MLQVITAISVIADVSGYRVELAVFAASVNLVGLLADAIA
jgi:hypothetical protein